MLYKTIIFFLLSNLIFPQSLTNAQLNKLKEQLAENNVQTVSKPTAQLEEFTPEAIEISSVSSSGDKKKFFGYNYFLKDLEIYDNIPIPSNYVLGPGDNIIISLWGESNSRTNLTLNKDGSIFYDEVGFINLSNKTINEAEVLLKEKLSTIYSTLKDENNPTSLSIEVGKLKSINIYFSGHIENPGINLVHPFSDIFSAIVQAGGVTDKGSLREVQLIRNNQLITTVDFYSFFINGENTFSNTKLMDGDIIHIPNFKKRVKISGEVNRPYTYELLFNESVSDIIEYASGFTSSASSTLILNQIIPIEERLSDDNARTSIAINVKNIQSIILNDGDEITISPISTVDTQISIYGRVKSPGNYPGVNTTLKNVLDIAGGFDDPIFRQTIREDEIVVLRRDSNKFYSLEIEISYKNSDNFQLMPNDKIFVYEDINYRNNFTYRVEGEVNKPGTFSLKNGTTVQEALERAQGLTDLSTQDNIIVYQEFTEFQEDGTEITRVKDVANVSTDFVLGTNSVIKALPFENVVNVEGNVYNPGLIAYYRGMTMAEAIIQAGGYRPYSMKKRVFVRKANGEIDKANLFRGKAKRISPGDTVVVPVNPDPSEFDITAFIADLSTTFANIAAILLIIDKQSD